MADVGARGTKIAGSDEFAGQATDNAARLFLDANYFSTLSAGDSTTNGVTSAAPLVLAPELESQSQQKPGTVFAPQPQQINAGQVASIAFTAVQSDNSGGAGGDYFQFVLLAPVTTGTTIYFTDNGYRTDVSAFRTNENMLRWVAQSNLAAGTVVSFVAPLGAGPASTAEWTGITPSSGATLGTAAFGLATAGDNITALVNPTFGGTDALTGTAIAAITWGGATFSPTFTASSGNGTTALPPGLTDGVNAVSIAATDNGLYTGTTFAGTQDQLLAALNNEGNWSTSTNPFTTFAPATAFTVQPSGAFSINDPVAVAEGNSGTTAITFTVTRSGTNLFGAASVDWALDFTGVSNPANGADFSGSTSGTVNFATDQTTATITVNVAGDVAIEPNENFRVVLSNNTAGTTTSDNSGTGTITNDDLPNVAPTFAVSTFATTRVSTTGAGAQQTGGGATTGANGTLSVSADGTRLVFQSSATNLVSGDTNAVADTFVKDLVTGAVTRVSVGTTGAQLGAASTLGIISPDGTRILFNNNSNVSIYDTATGTSSVASATTGGAGLGQSFAGVFSPDGTRIAFFSYNSGAAGDTNGNGDIYLKTLVSGATQTGALTWISLTSTGGVGNNQNDKMPLFSGDGARIAWSTDSTNMVPNDTNGVYDVVIRDIATNNLSRVSTTSTGVQGNGHSTLGSINFDGTKVVIISAATNFTSGADANGAQQDIFIKDLTTGSLTLVSSSAAGVQSNGTSLGGILSPDGTRVAFISNATNLVAGDTNGQYDLFVKTLATGAIQRISTATDGTQGNGGFGTLGQFSSNFITWSPDSSTVYYTSDSTNLVAGDTNAQADVFATFLGAGATQGYVENGPAVQLVSNVTVGDPDSAVYAGGTLTIAITGGAATGDVLSLSGTGITVSGTDVSYNSTVIGTLTASATSLSIALNASATDAAVQAITQAARFANTTEAPATAARTITFTLVDGGGTTGGGNDTASFTRTVSAVSVNDAPAGTDGSVTVGTGTTRAFTAADFGFSDIDGNSLAAVRITTLPSAGTIFYDADGAGGSLTYTAAASAGTPGFTFQVQDNGGTANGGVDLDQSANTLTLNVTPLNNAPAGTNATLTISEDAPRTLTATDFGFSDTDGNNLLAVTIT
ncbi:beta strand repeat-containing protein, partial [Sphingomonas sp. CCH10-B3]|uniref:beta strand repeat-containing protein n=1 Tax=Sphingomonas sp. CCH10-B3 TaxID=1768757 RepID=UPI0009E94447